MDAIYAHYEGPYAAGHEVNSQITIHSQSSQQLLSTHIDHTRRFFCLPNDLPGQGKRKIAGTVLLKSNSIQHIHTY